KVRTSSCARLTVRTGMAGPGAIGCGWVGARTGTWVLRGPQAASVTTKTANAKVKRDGKQRRIIRALRDRVKRPRGARRIVSRPHRRGLVLPLTPHFVRWSFVEGRVSNAESLFPRFYFLKTTRSNL